MELKGHGLDHTIELRTFKDKFKVPDYKLAKYTHLQNGQSSVAYNETKKSPSRKEPKRLFNLPKTKLLAVQDQIKAMTPQNQLKKLNFAHMDERDTILEHYNAKAKLVKRWRSKVSCSPVLRRRNRSADGCSLSPHTNLRAVVDQKPTGCVEEQFS